jgi:hypothetical protein
MGASTGNFGTVRAQMHLLNKSEVLVFRAVGKFDSEGHLTDETTRGLVRELLLTLGEWTHQLRSSG